MKKKILLVLLSIALVVSLAAFAACKEKEGEEGGTIRYIILSEPAGYDAHRKISYSPIFSLPVFSNLVYLDPAADTLSPENIIGDLAERWEISDDGKTWTFYLHEGVKWHDGQPCTADDVIYSIEKMMDPQRSAVSSNFATVEQVVKVDDYTVQIVLEAASPFFLVSLSSAYCPIQAEHLADVEYNSTDFLVGTGPFMFNQLDAGVSAELVKNPDYFKEGLPYLDSVIIYFMADRTAQLNALVSGRADLAFSNLTNQEMLDEFNALKPEDATLFMFGADLGASYFFNLDYEPLQDKNVRKALMLLMDRTQQVIASYGDIKWATIEHAWFPRPYGLPKEEIDQITGWDKSWDERVAEAKRLLAETDYEDGFPLKLSLSPMLEVQRGMLWWADVLERELNIQVETEVVEYAELYSTKMSGDFQVFPDMVYCLLLDPNEFSPLFECGNPANFIHYCDPEVDSLFEQQAVEMDLDTRIEIAQDIERILLDEAISIPLAWNIYGVIDRTYIHGFVRTNTAYTSELKWESVWIEK